MAFPAVILLPKTLDRRDTATLQFVLTHEWVHVRRWDALIKLLFANGAGAALVQSAGLAALLLGNRDLELSCDAAVVRRGGAGVPGRLCAGLAGIGGKEKRASPLLQPLEPQLFGRRVKSIMQYKRASAVAVFLAMLLVVGITSAFALRPETTAQIQLHEPAAPENSVSGEAALGETQDGYTVASQLARR